MEERERRAAIALVAAIRAGDTEEEVDEMIEDLEGYFLLPSGRLTNYIFWTELSDEEVVDKALEYEPIAL
ncbi:hypothetical protein [Catellatospora sichuanensis]|uniref:hypothetical protein n=1 Tax=Catellatospora sichuanensis TaxID=1969805 RepID=UPI0011821348|nr:hypothetical protein [Catellatospora sichuanensis]